MKLSKRILYVGNDAGYFVSHRLPQARAARAAGYEVHVATPLAREVELIRAEGFEFHALPVKRWGRHVWEEIASFLAFYRLYRSIRPDLVYHVTIKPILYGGIMARLARVPAVVNAVTGLGYVFVAQDYKVRLLRVAVKMAYRLALRHPKSRVIFQNPDDLNSFLKEGLVDKSNAVLIKGSGVDVDRFSVVREPVGPPVVMLASRMLWDKGVGEFVKAATLLKGVGIDARFVLVGGNEPDNPATVSTDQLQVWDRSGVVEWWGRHEDMPAVFSQAHVVCLPSYREGVPKVLIEAAACGRPIVTTDVPGCREIVRHGENGLLVPVRDAAALADALRRLIEDPVLRQRMGAKGREIVVSEFSLEKVISEILVVYRELLA